MHGDAHALCDSHDRCLGEVDGIRPDRLTAIVEEQRAWFACLDGEFDQRRKKQRPQFEMPKRAKADADKLEANRVATRGTRDALNQALISQAFNVSIKRRAMESRYRGQFRHRHRGVLIGQRREDGHRGVPGLLVRRGRLVQD